MKQFTKLGLVSIISMAFALPVAAKSSPKAAPVAAKSKASAPVVAAAKTAVKTVKAEPKVAAVKTAKVEPQASKKTAEVAKMAKNSKAAEPKTVIKTSIKETVKTVKPATAAKSNASKPALHIASAKPVRNVVKVSYKPATKVVAKAPEAKTEYVQPKPIAKVTSPTPRVYRPSGSVARQYGLNQSFDPVGLRASVALVVDQNNWTTLYEKNASTPLPIASITKLMTAMVVLDARQDLNEYITISEEDAAHYRSSRLTVGSSLPRRDVMLLALMSSENRAAYALGRSYPGGISSFVQAMNAKAMMLGMNSAQFVDPSGLSPSNQASAMDLAKMVNAATQYKTIRELSTNDSAYVYTADGQYKKYMNSNRLISRNMGWDIGLQKTGTLSAAGKCLVLQTRINGSPKIMVFLDSSSADSRVADAVKLKNWVEGGNYTNSAAVSEPFAGFSNGGS